MTYFNPTPATCEDLKQQFRQLVVIHHPDNGGDEKAMKAVNNEFDELFEKLKDTHRNAQGEVYTSRTPSDETPEQFREIIETLIHFEGTKIEIIGSFIWVSGNTYKYKEIIKGLGFKFSSNKVSWYLAPADYHKRNKKQFALDEIRNMFGSREIETQQTAKVSAGA